MSLCNRYPDNPGCGVRLDSPTTPRQGVALDLGLKGGGPDYTLWTRDEKNEQVTIPLSLVDLENLRDGLSRILVHEKVNREITVAVPV